MKERHTITPFLLLIFSFILFHSSCSNITIAVNVPASSALTFCLAPLPTSQNLTIALTVTYTTNSSGLLTYTTIFSSVFLLTKKNKYTVWNFQNDGQVINIYLQSDTYLDQNMLWVESIGSREVFLAVFDDQTTGGFMLPFNMLSLKTLNLYVVEHGQPLQLNTYNLEPYMATYWTEKKSSVQLITHLPYLSECSLQKAFIQIHDLLQPTNCWLGDFGLQCAQKTSNFACILEQLEVSNVDAQFWFNNNQQIIYYLLPYPISLPDLADANQALDGVNALVLTLFDRLVPMYYHRNSPDSVIVNQFHFNFQVTIGQDSQLQMHIVSAKIQGKYNPAMSSPNAEVYVHVKYLNLLERFNAYDLPSFWYVGYAGMMAALLGGGLWLLAVRGCGLRLKLKEKVRQVLVPAAKGCFYTLATGGCFFALINEISFRTNYSSVSGQYGAALQDEELQLNNIGRSGLTVTLVAVYLMSAAIKQACQVQSADWKDLKVVFEDDAKLEGRAEMNEQELQQKIYFAKKNIVSQQKYILLCSLLMTFMGFWYLEFLLSLTNAQVAIAFVSIVPIMSKIVSQQMKFLIVKELLYISGNLLSLVIVSYLLLLKSQSMMEFTYLYLARFIHLYVQVIIMEIVSFKLIMRLDQAVSSSNPSKVSLLLGKLFQRLIDFHRKESVYQRGIYVGSVMAMEVMAVALLPLVALTMYLLGRTTLLESNLLMGAGSGVGLLMLLALMPLDLLMIAVLMELTKKRGIRMEEVIRFNRFRFRRRKFPWLNDEFSLSRTVNFFYRQYQKFGFSSQLYFVISLMGFSGFLFYLGVLMMVQSEYMLGNDPVMLVVMPLILAVGDVSSLVLPLLARRLRLYYKREEEAMRVNLLKIDKYLRNNTDTLEYYLTLQGVKEYFLDYNAEWIVHHLPAIFSKEDFEENGGQLINRYKHYKSLFKKRQIDEKRRIKRLKENSVMSQPAALPPEPQLALPRRPFLLFARPLATYWLYLARQSLHLKAIVASVRRDKMRKNCQFCNMDVELQALQRRDFQQLANEFRLLNVNRAFDPAAFLEFYRLKQKYVTICVECKEKNLHLEGRVSRKEVPAKLMKRWHLIAKSVLLHPPKRGHSPHNA